MNETLNNVNPELEHDPVDGTFEIAVDAALMQASLSVKPPYFGGKAVEEKDILKELSVRQITYGVDQDSIRSILERNLFETPYIIATGLKPENGTDGTITYLFDKVVENKPKEDEHGFVNYKDLGLIRNITAGTTIADITLPTEGSQGINIKNQIIRQRPGAPALATHGANIGISEDGLRMVALADGNLKYSGKQFSIDTVFDMKGDVDISTGNLDFIGDIIVRGEVMEGFKVSSQKNITVYGNVTGANIEANGDVTIKKGCINSKIRSHGNVSVDFVESSNIACDGDLKADAFIFSDIYCGGELTASGKRGALMGGKYTCLKNLSAQTIGTKSYTSTVITVGDNAVMVEERADKTTQLENINTQILRCTQAIDFLNAKKAEFGGLPAEKEEQLDMFIKVKIQSEAEKSKLEKRIAEITEYLEQKENLSITCKKELYPGVKITINDFVMQVNTTYQYCRIYLDSDGIKTETL